MGQLYLVRPLQLLQLPLPAGRHLRFALAAGVGQRHSLGRVDLGQSALGAALALGRTPAHEPFGSVYPAAGYASTG